MNKNWPTKEVDMQTAQQFMENFATKNKRDSLGLFELIVDTEEKRMNFRLSNWVLAMAEHFKSLYGAHQGDFVTRQIITRCLTNGETLH